MIGMPEYEIFEVIDRACSELPHLFPNIPEQKALDPKYILGQIATGVAKAISANNAVIEHQLHQIGLRI